MSTGTTRSNLFTVELCARKKNIYQKTKIKPPETGHVTKTKKINRNSGSGVSAGDDGDDEGAFFSL